MTSLKKKQIPRSARNDNSGAFARGGAEVGVRRSADSSGAQKARAVRGFAPGIGAESFTVFVLGDVDGLHEGLGQVGDSTGGSGFHIAANNGGDEASQGGT